MRKSLEEGKRISIWFVTGNLPPYFSGAGNNDYLLAPYCAKNGMEVTLVTSRKKGDPKNQIINGVNILRINIGNDRNNLWRIIGPINFVKSIFRNSRPLIIRFRGFSFRISLMVFLLRIIFPKIYIIVQPAMFGGDDAHSIRKKVLGSFQLHQILKVDAIFSMNCLIKESFVHAGYPKEKIFSVQNPVDSNKFYAPQLNKKIKMRKILGLDENLIIYITSGIISTRKRQSFITEAFLKLVEKSTEKLLLIHMGPRQIDLKRLRQEGAHEDVKRECDNIERLVKSSKYAKCISLIGNQKMPEKYLQIADFFVHASKFEGEVNVVNEALSCGLPCLLPDIPLYRKQFTSDYVLFYYEDSPESLYKKMNEMIIAKKEKPLDFAHKKNILIEGRSPAIIANNLSTVLLKITEKRKK